MIEWNEQQQQIQSMIRRFVETEIAPKLEKYEFGDHPPYDALRKMGKIFGLDELARARFNAKIGRHAADADDRGDRDTRSRSPDQIANDMAMQILMVMELSRYSPGMVTALGVSMGLTANAIMARGTERQKRDYALPLMTLEKIGSWAITEPGSGSDAFGSMKSVARRDGNGGYVLNGSKTFITNGPYADTIVFICKLDEDNDPADRKILSFILDKDLAGLTRSKPLRKMGLHSSPTGELFLEDVYATRDHLLGGSEEAQSREGAKTTFSTERTGVAAMALGIVEQCCTLCIDYARTRVQFGRPIGEFQLIQLKLAKMEVARMNIQNLVFRQIEMAGEGKSMTLAEASACKLYSAQAAMEVCLEAVQLFGGNGYMAEYQVEQLCRDAKVLQIYGGTDEIQISQIARDLMKT